MIVLKRKKGFKKVEIILTIFNTAIELFNKKYLLLFFSTLNKFKTTTIKYRSDVSDINDANAVQLSKVKCINALKRAQRIESQCL